MMVYQNFVSRFRGLRGIEVIVQWIKQSAENFVYMIQRLFEKIIIC